MHIGQRDLVYDKNGIMGALVATDYKQPKQIAELNQLGTLDIKGMDCIKRVYGTNGISPALTTMQGGNRQPKILDFVGGIGDKDWVGDNKKLSRNYPQGNRVYNSKGIACSQTSNGGGLGGTTGLYLVNLPCICASRGRNPENPSDRTAGAPTEQRLEFNTKGTSNTITTVQKDNYVVETTYRIRKLTPRECFRLMGMRDDDIDKIQRAGISNTQQYKMAGNSIVVNVLEAIFKELFL